MKRIVPLLIVVAGLAATPSDCHAATTKTVNVDGLNGLTTGIPTPLNPGDTLGVQVCRADLINYNYSIAVNEEQILVAYPVVGATEPVAAPAEGAVGPSAAASLAKTPTDIRSALILAHQELAAVDEETRRSASKIEDAEASVTSELAKCSGNCTCAWPALEPTPIPVARLLGLIATADHIGHQLEGVRLGAGTSAAELTLLEKSLGALKDGITTVKTRTGEANARVGRWNVIYTLNPRPVATYAVRIKNANTRYTVAVQRTPATDSAKATNPAVGSDGKALLTLATFDVEGHQLARFGIGVGLAGFFLPHAQAFGVVDSLVDDKVVRHVRETAHDSFEGKAVAMLEVYWHRIDATDPARKLEPMLLVGSEISSSPSRFFVGVGLDSSSGAFASIGVTHYNSTELAEGWGVGMEIPADKDGHALVAAVPTVSRGALGAFLGIGFRPAIFSRLWNLVTGKN